MKPGLNKAAGALALLLLAASAGAADLPVYRLALKGNQFVPATLVVPPGQKFKLVVSNEDDAPAEFESFILHREQLVGSKKEATIFIGPLKKGRYEFFDDFHPKTRGWLEAAPPAEKKP